VCSSFESGRKGSSCEDRSEAVSLDSTHYD
jgi:hypothetical protein